MEPDNRRFRFSLSPVNTEEEQAETARGLQQLTEQRSRKVCPGLWKITDRLRAKQKPLSAGQRKKRILLGALDAVLGFALILPGLMEPETMLGILIVGILAFLTGAVILWRQCARVFGITALILGAFLTGGILLAGPNLFPLLPAGTGLLIAGAIATAKKLFCKADRFQRSARQLLLERNRAAVLSREPEFTEDGLSVQGKNGLLLFPYEKIRQAAETESLYLLDGKDWILLLKKQDLADSTPEEFSEFLREKVPLCRTN